MHIACPKCAVGFDLPEAIIGTKGRRLKCASCGRNWFQGADGRQVLLDAQSAPKPGADAPLPTFASTKRSSEAQPSKPGQSSRDQGPIATSDQVARSLAAMGEQHVEVRPAQSMRERGPAAGAPGHTPAAHPPGEVAASDQVARSLAAMGEQRVQVRPAQSIRERGAEPIVASGQAARSLAAMGEQHIEVRPAQSILERGPERIVAGDQGARSLSGLGEQRIEVRPAQSLRERGPERIVAGDQTGRSLSALGEQNIEVRPAQSLREREAAPGQAPQSLIGEAARTDAQPAQSLRDQGPIVVRGADAVTQGPEKVVSSGQAARSLLGETTRTETKSAPGQAAPTHTRAPERVLVSDDRARAGTNEPAQAGQQGRGQKPGTAPGAASASASQDAKTAAPGEAARTLVYDTEKPTGEAARTLVHDTQKTGEAARTLIHDTYPPEQAARTLVHETQKPGEAARTLIHDTYPPEQAARTLVHDTQKPGEAARTLIHDTYPPEQAARTLVHETPTSDGAARTLVHETPTTNEAPRTLVYEKPTSGEAPRTLVYDNNARRAAARAARDQTTRAPTAETLAAESKPVPNAQAATEDAELDVGAPVEAGADTSGDEASTSGSGDTPGEELATQSNLADEQSPAPHDNAAKQDAKPGAKKRKRKSDTKYYLMASLVVGIAGALAAFFLLARHGSNNDPNAPKVTIEALKIAESSQQVVRLDGVETLVVSGYVSNIGDVVTAMPNLRLELYNEKRDVLKTGTTPACAPVLSPKGSCRFSIKIGSPDLDSAKGGHAVVWDK